MAWVYMPMALLCGGGDGTQVLLRHVVVLSEGGRMLRAVASSAASDADKAHVTSMLRLPVNPLSFDTYRTTLTGAVSDPGVRDGAVIAALHETRSDDLWSTWDDKGGLQALLRTMCELALEQRRWEVALWVLRLPHIKWADVGHVVRMAKSYVVDPLVCAWVARRLHLAGRLKGKDVEALVTACRSFEDQTEQLVREAVQLACPPLLRRLMRGRPRPALALVALESVSEAEGEAWEALQDSTNMADTKELVLECAAAAVTAAAGGGEVDTLRQLLARQWEARHSWSTMPRVERRKQRAVERALVACKSMPLAADARRELAEWLREGRKQLDEQVHEAVQQGRAQPSDKVNDGSRPHGGSCPDEAESATLEGGIKRERME